MATNWITRDALGIAPEAMIVLSGSVIANTVLCSHDTTTGGIKPFDGTDADRLVGWHFGDSVTGAGSALGTGTQVHARIHRGGFSVVNLTVTGLNVTTPSASWGATVYASDSDSYTLVATGNVIVGTVVANRTGCTAVTKGVIHMDNVYGNVT
jgi:hypothetical protein